MVTYKVRALDLLDSLENGYLGRIEECRREIARATGVDASVHEDLKEAS